MNFLIVFLGGGIGSVSRYLLTKTINNYCNLHFPFGTLVVNLGGCFIIGFLFTLFEELVVPSEWRLLLITGFLGGFTTFSSFGLESVNLIKAGEFLPAAGNIAASVMLGLLFVLLGMYLSSILFKGSKIPV